MSFNPFTFSVRTTNVACLTLCLYEYGCTFSREVSVIWKAGWNIPKTIYLAARVLPPILLTAMIYTFETRCSAYIKLFTWGTHICLLLSEVIFVLRTWAIWDRSRRMAVFLFIFFSVQWVVSFMFNGLSWTGAGIDKWGPPDGRCLEIEESLVVVFPLVIYIMPGFYFVTLLLTMVKTYLNLIRPSGSVTTLMRVVHLDGIAYYAYLLVIWIAILVSYLLDPNSVRSPYWVNILILVQVTMSSILSCRMTLRLREYGSRTVRGLGSQRYTSGFSFNQDPLVFRHTDLGLDARNFTTRDSAVDEEE